MISTMPVNMVLEVCGVVKKVGELRANSGTPPGDRRLYTHSTYLVIAHHGTILAFAR